MYEVYYYINRKPIRYEFAFNSIYAAVLKAKAIFEEHGIPADLLDPNTGEVLAIFEPGNVFISDLVKTDRIMRALL